MTSGDDREIIDICLKFVYARSGTCIQSTKTFRETERLRTERVERRWHRERERERQRDRDRDREIRNRESGETLAEREERQRD